MRLTKRLAALLLAALFYAPVAPSQEAKKPDPGEEDARLRRIVERWVQTNETEHEHVLHEVARGGPAADDDFGLWYTRLGGDDDGWDRKRIQRGSVTEIFDRIARSLETQGSVLSRSQFLDYARQHWRKEKSPPWREAPTFETGAEAERLFQRLDHDRDGQLSDTEMSPALQAELKRWDTNGDGWINLEEYRPYFEHRLDKIFRDSQQRSDRMLPTLNLGVPANDERPHVMRAGRLPVGLPAWFEQLDQDGDGQIALHEWRRAGWPLGEFKTLDQDDDGFLEPREVLKLLSMTEPDGNRPYGYLMQKRIGKSGR